MTKTEDGRRFCLRIEAAGHYAPTEEQLRTAEPIQPKPRQFRLHNRHIPSVMHGRTIQAFFTEMNAKNELFYQAHPEALFKIELLDYADYLQSPFWFVTRNTVLYRDGYKCRVCAAKATTVHHISYDADVLYGKNLEPLVSVCDRCHEAIEFDEDGAKITDLAVKKARYEELRDNR